MMRQNNPSAGLSRRFQQKVFLRHDKFDLTHAQHTD